MNNRFSFEGINYVISSAFVPYNKKIREKVLYNFSLKIINDQNVAVWSLNSLNIRRKFNRTTGVSYLEIGSPIQSFGDACKATISYPDSRDSAQIARREKLISILLPLLEEICKN